MIKASDFLRRGMRTGIDVILSAISSGLLLLLINFFREPDIGLLAFTSFTATLTPVLSTIKNAVEDKTDKALLVSKQRPEPEKTEAEPQPAVVEAIEEDPAAGDGPDEPEVLAVSRKPKAFFTGYLPSPADHRDIRYSLVAPALKAPLPASYDFERGKAALPRIDQGQTPSCLGWALALVKIAQERKEARRTIPFDGEALYRNFALPEGGAYSRAGLAFLRHTGADYRGTRYPIQAYAGVAPTNHDEVKHALLTEGVLLGGMNVPASFLDGGGKEFGKTGGSGDEIVGGHAIAIVGYTPQGVILHNSWGSSWGDNGRCLVTWDFFDTYFDEVWTTVDAKNPAVARKINKFTALAATT